MSTEARVYLLLGSNLGDRQALLSDAGKLIESRAGRITKSSGIYETASWGSVHLPAHLNQALEIHTLLQPIALLDVLQEIEASLGRERSEKWGLRTIDIDIIYYNDEIIGLPRLKVPHPLLQERRFVLTPLAEIASDYVHPILKMTTTEMLLHTRDQLSVNAL